MYLNWTVFSGWLLLYNVLRLLGLQSINKQIWHILDYGGCQLICNPGPQEGFLYNSVILCVLLVLPYLDFELRYCCLFLLFSQVDVIMLGLIVIRNSL